VVGVWIVGCGCEGGRGASDGGKGEGLKLGLGLWESRGERTSMFMDAEFGPELGPELEGPKSEKLGVLVVVERDELERGNPSCCPEA
jgi:hypothetical protein